MRGRFVLKDERGQVAALVAVMLFGLIVLVGLVIDAGLLFASRRDLQGLADGAARAGAMAVDELALRNGESGVRLDPDMARLQAREYLSSAGFAGSSDIKPGPDGTEVTLEMQRRTLIMAIVGIREVTVRASSTASPRYGIDSVEGGP